MRGKNQVPRAFTKGDFVVDSRLGKVSKTTALKRLVSVQFSTNTMGRKGMVVIRRKPLTQFHRTALRSTLSVGRME
jgi:hypothetical protein